MKCTFCLSEYFPQSRKKVESLSNTIFFASLIWGRVTKDFVDHWLKPGEHKPELKSNAINILDDYKYMTKSDSGKNREMITEGIKAFEECQAARTAGNTLETKNKQKLSSND